MSRTSQLDERTFMLEPVRVLRYRETKDPYGLMIVDGVYLQEGDRVLNYGKFCNFPEVLIVKANDSWDNTSEVGCQSPTDKILIEVQEGYDCGPAVWEYENRSLVRNILWQCTPNKKKVNI